jgi:hypothetical protein
MTLRVTPRQGRFEFILAARMRNRVRRIDEFAAQCRE